jgi:hypothetical protein
MINKNFEKNHIEKNLLGNVSLVNYKLGNSSLWSFDKIPNSFALGSESWNNEENKRLFEYAYWEKIATQVKLSPESIILYKDKIREDVKNFILYIYYVSFLIKINRENLVYFPPYLYTLFSLYIEKILNLKDYNIQFLKQNSFVLKKYDILKNLFLRESSEKNFNIKVKFFSYIYYFNYNFISSKFEFFYLYPVNVYVDKEVRQKLNFFYKLLYFFKDWFLSVKEGYKNSFFFFNNRFFYLDFNRILKIYIEDKKIIKPIFFNKIELAILEEQKNYIYSLDPYIDLGDLEEEEDTFFYNLFSNSFFNFEDRCVVLESLEFTNDFFLSFSIDKIYYFLNLNLKNNEELVLAFNTLLGWLNVSLIKKEEIYNFFIKIFDLVFIEKNNIDNFSYNSVLNYNSNFLNSNNIVNFLEEIYDDSTLKKYKFLIFDDLGSLKKNLKFSPILTRSFFIEKVLFMKEQGNIKKFNSYIIFLEKYLHFYYFLSFPFKKKFIYLKNLYEKQSNLSIMNEFSGSFSYNWIFFSYGIDFSFSRQAYTELYLNVKKYSNLKYMIFSFSNEGKSVYEISFLQKKGSSGFYKYSAEFLLKNYDNFFSLEELSVFKDEKSYYNSNGLFFQFLSFFKRVISVIDKKLI